jgi:putative nucleotidyltransferase with HDIG domain
MLKKVSSSQLKPGMFVVDLNAGWLDHPFVRNKLRVSAEDIALIRDSGIQEVTIDTDRGPDAEGPSLESVQQENTAALKALASEPALKEPPPPQGLWDEPRARAAIDHAILALRQMMDDVKLGKPLDFPVLSDVARQVAHEVISNPAIAVVVYHLHRHCEYTYAHCVRVAILCVSCAHRMGFSATECHEIALGGLIHDVGKACVNQAILQKPSKLSPEEMSHMREHVNLGLLLVRKKTLPATTLAVLWEHHERFDGNGYPRKLVGAQISRVGRISGLADVYDAISSDRWYHKALPPPAAIRKIHEWSKYHFDREVTAHFVRAVGIYPVGSLVRLSNHCLAVVVQQNPLRSLYPRVLLVFDLLSKRLLQPREEMDLSESGNIQIESYEEPSDWGIDPGEYL